MSGLFGSPASGLLVFARCMECRRGLAMRILFVRPSVKRMHCDKTEEQISPDFYIIQKII